jgi:hypothetical protein
MLSVQEDRIVAETPKLRMRLDTSTGAILEVRNLATDQVLLEGPGGVPWRLTAPGTTNPFLPGNPPPSYSFTQIQPDGFSYVVSDDGASASLEWTTTDPGIRVSATLRAGLDDSLELWPRVSVAEGTSPPTDFTYPVLQGPKQLSSLGANDVLVFPAHSGWLIRRPLSQLFPVAADYPDGYIGCSVQLMAYYEESKGGFYLATHDPHSTWKTFSFGGGEVSFKHSTWDRRYGADIDLDYPVVIAPLERGDWFEASERYRRWVEPSAPWCARGPRRNDDFARWLRDEVWVSLWCTPSAHDWSQFYRFYTEELEAPIHFVAGWEWPATRPHTVGKEGWFPANFHPANLEAWKGHYVTPYTNDWFISPAAESFIEKWEPEIVRPYTYFTFPLFSHPREEQINGEGPRTDPRITTDMPFFLCPASPAQRDLHAWRAVGLARDYGMAGAFYDISSAIPTQMSRCLNASHDHPPGRGRHLIQSLEEVNRSSRNAVSEQTGREFAQGTETIIENLIGSLDFYVSRAAAGPMGALEAWAQGPEEPPGVGRELIPLFQSVYHDLGPVHEDGWIRLVAEEKDLFFWIAARIMVQWGGLLSIHYPLDPAERPPGYEGGSETVAWGGERLVFDELPELDRDKTGFIKELGRARTTFAKPYLAYGRMVRPAPLEAETIELSFYQELLRVKELRNQGTWTVPRVIHSAWIDDATGKLGLMLVNLEPSEASTVTLDVDLAKHWSLDGSGRKVVQHTSQGETVLGVVGDDNVLRAEVDLPPRKAVLVEV